MGDIKLKDIAKALHVSSVTVSNALSGKKGVSDDVRELIFQTAKEMGYDLSRYEKTVRVSRIGVIVPKKYLEVGISFYWAMYQMVACAASKKQGVTVLEVLETASEKRGMLPQIVQKKAVDGLIVIGWVERDYVGKLVKKSGIPVVLLDSSMRGLPCDAVLSGNYVGMYKVTRYLLERGHRDIAFVGSVLANRNIMDRYYGYKKGMMEAGIVPEKDWCLEDRDIVTGELRICLPKRMPTAFVCNSDLTASRLYDVLVKEGYRVPEDISIAGYDNYLFGHSFAQKLTTYNVDMKGMADTAMKLLLKKIQGSEKRFGVRCIDSAVIERGSVRVRGDKAKGAKDLG